MIFCSIPDFESVRRRRLVQQMQKATLLGDEVRQCISVMPKGDISGKAGSIEFKGEISLYASK